MSKSNGLLPGDQSADSSGETNALPVARSTEFSPDTSTCGGIEPNPMEGIATGVYGAPLHDIGFHHMINSRDVMTRKSQSLATSTTLRALCGPPAPDSSRERDFQGIREALESSLRARSQHALLAEGDSLPLLRRLPDHSISLVLTDPPYHATKKRNIYGDNAFSGDDHYLEWVARYAEEWRRILRPNGSLFCFCDSSMAARLETMFAGHFNVLSHVVWTKPNDPGFDGWKGKMKKQALRQWYPHSERILFAEPAEEGNLFRSPFGNLLREMRRKAGLSMHQLAAKIGAHGRVNHGGAVSNWEDGRNTPSREQYEKIYKALIETGKVGSMPRYEDAVRPFVMDSAKEFTDVWTFPSVRPYKGKHPAEKPASMLEHAIEATTFPDDIVLDCFAGSGSTGFAAIKLGRRTVLMEIDPLWVSKTAQRLRIHLRQDPHHAKILPGLTAKLARTSPQLPLFFAGE